MKLIRSVHKQLVARLRKQADALGKSINDTLHRYLRRVAGADDADQSIANSSAFLARAIRADGVSIVTR
jgi:hypothetical protein